VDKSEEVVGEEEREKGEKIFSTIFMLKMKEKFVYSLSLSRGKKMLRVLHVLSLEAGGRSSFLHIDDFSFHAHL
jgi:hypothetical protein